MKMKTLDISKIGSGCSLIQLTGKVENPILKKAYEPELKQKFQIGDKVKFAKDMLDFAGVNDDGTVFSVIGVQKTNDQFLYELDPGYWTFFGYELEKA